MQRHENEKTPMNKSPRIRLSWRHCRPPNATSDHGKPNDWLHEYKYEAPDGAHLNFKIVKLYFTLLAYMHQVQFPWVRIQFVRRRKCTLLDALFSPVVFNGSCTRYSPLTFVPYSLVPSKRRNQQRLPFPDRSFRSPSTLSTTTRVSNPFPSPSSFPSFRLRREFKCRMVPLLTPPASFYQTFPTTVILHIICLLPML